MPTDPIEQAETARTTLRLLAEATRRVDDPDQLYAVIDDIRGGVQALQETLAQLADAHTLYQARAISLNGDPVTGQATAADAHTALQGGRTVTLQEGRTAATTMRLLDEHELFDTTSRMTT